MLTDEQLFNIGKAYMAAALRGSGMAGTLLAMREVIGTPPAASGEAVPLADELQKLAAAADTDGDDYTAALSLRAPEPPTPVGLRRNHSRESAWRVGWMRGWMAARKG